MFRIRPYIGKAFMHFIFNNISLNILQEAVTRKFVYPMPITCAHLLNIFFVTATKMNDPAYVFVLKTVKIGYTAVLVHLLLSNGGGVKVLVLFCIVAITCLDDLTNNKNLLLFRLSTNNGSECWMILLTRWFF